MTNPHPLVKCRGFKAKPMEECRTSDLKENNVCFRCCASNSDLARDCRMPLKCRECESERHSTAMHPGPGPWTSNPAEQECTEQETEKQENLSDLAAVISQCTEICGTNQPACSCSKICLVKVYKKVAVNMYAILDNQSNRSLAHSEFFDLFDIQSIPHPYSLRTCAGVIEMTGRKAHEFQIEACSGGVSIDLPPLIECNEILDNRSEIPTPEVAACHPHLKPIVRFIPKIDSIAQTLLLLGRDLIRVHKVRQQINGPHNSPFAQRLDLGWVMIGEVCLGNVHKPNVNSFRMNMFENGRPSFLTPCASHISLKERAKHGGEANQHNPGPVTKVHRTSNDIGHSV